MYIVNNHLNNRFIILIIMENNDLNNILFFNMSNSYLKNIIKGLDHNYVENIKKLITPMSMYLLSDYYFGLELEYALTSEIKNEYEKIKKLTLSKNIYLDRTLLDKIEDYHIIAIQGGPSGGTDWSYNFYDDFIQNILPKINKKIILIIGHYSLAHFIQEGEGGANINKIINNNNVILCFLQNYGMLQRVLNIDKLKAFPYGLNIDKQGMNCYIDKLKEYHLGNKMKNININHLNLGPNCPIREIYPKKQRLPHNIFYEKMYDSKFLLSPVGDRWDTYRNYECIGLETIPISTQGALSLVFNDNMLYVNEKINETYDISINDNDNNEKKNKHMIDLYEKQKIPIYKKPNCDLITTKYWNDYIINIINKYKS